MRTGLVAIVSISASVLVLLWALARRQSLLAEASLRRTAAAEARLRQGRLNLREQLAAAQQPVLALKLKLAAKAEATKLARVRQLTRELEWQQQEEYERRALWKPASPTSAAPDEQEAGPAWHALGGIGDCPASIPDWDWSLLHRAASPNNDGPERESALAQLSSRSHISTGVLSDIARREHTLSTRRASVAQALSSR